MSLLARDMHNLMGATWGVTLAALIFWPMCNVASAHDWRDADHCWYAKVDDSGPGGHFNDNAQVVITDDGTWVSAWTTGSAEASADMHIVVSRSHDHGRTWSARRPIEAATETTTAAYGYLFKSPINGRIFSMYRFHDEKVIAQQIRELGGDSGLKNVLGHFHDTVGTICFRYSDDHGETWSGRHEIPTRRTRVDNPTGPLAGWFFGIGPVIIDDHVWFSGNKHKPVGANRWETWFWKSPNMHRASDPWEFIWENKPAGEVGIVPDKGIKYWVEASLVQLDDADHLYCVARNRYAGYLGQSFSTDGGETWQNPPSAAEYWDGSGRLNNPKAGPMLKQLSDGTYLLTFFNDRARPDDKIHWSKLYDRSPLWCSVGWQDGNVLKFAQPELLLYNDEDVTASAEGNRSSIYAPFLFEADGEVFTVVSHKKTDVQITRIPRALIEGLKHQRTAAGIQRRHLLADIGLTPDSAAPIRTTIQGDPIRLTPLDEDGSFAMTFWVRCDAPSEGQTLLDGRDRNGRGVWVGLAERGKVRVELTDMRGRRETAQTASEAITRGNPHHVVVNVDGAADVLTILVDGRISGDNPRMNFKELDASLGDVNGAAGFTVGRSSPESHSSESPLRGAIERVRIYGKYLTTSRAIANFRAGPSSDR